MPHILTLNVEYSSVSYKGRGLWGLNLGHDGKDRVHSPCSETEQCLEKEEELEPQHASSCFSQTVFIARRK